MYIKHHHSPYPIFIYLNGRLSRGNSYPKGKYKVDNLPQPGFEDLNLNNTYTGVMQKTCNWSS